MGRLKTLKARVSTIPMRLATVSSGSWRAGKGTAAERGYGYRWQRARVGWLMAHPLCVMCEAEGKVVAATVVDHVVPHRGDMDLFWDNTNWQSLCGDCHKAKTARGE